MVSRIKASEHVARLHEKYLCSSSPEPHLFMTKTYSLFTWYYGFWEAAPGVQCKPVVNYEIVRLKESSSTLRRVEVPYCGRPFFSL